MALVNPSSRWNSSSSVAPVNNPSSHKVRCADRLPTVPTGARAVSSLQPYLVRKVEPKSPSCVLGLAHAREGQKSTCVPDTGTIFYKAFARLGARVLEGEDVGVVCSG